MYKWMVCSVLLSLALMGCELIPGEDRHPEIPYLKDFLQDSAQVTSVFAKASADSRLYFLQDGRLLFLPNVGKYSPGPSLFKIFDVEGRVAIELLYKDHEPLYMDSSGNLYYENIKYRYPDYRQAGRYATIVLQDSIEQKSLEMKYAVSPCVFTLQRLAKSCDVYEFRDNMLIIRQNSLYKNSFMREPESIAEFDQATLLRYAGGGGDAGVFAPIYLRYFSIGAGHRFKEADYPYPVKIEIGGKWYIYSVKYGLYRLNSMH